VNFLQNFFHTIYNVPELIRIVGQFGLPLIIFAETGLLIGFFLPGDSLLITAGLFAARGDLNLPLLIVTLIPAAILGNATGYQIGKRTGKALYSRPDSLLFRREHLRMTHEYYERHGGKTIIIAQFAPILRTFAPVVAGVAEMGYRRFASYNIIGAILWIISMTLTGYLLGNVIPGIDKRIDVLVMAIVAISLLPALIAWLRSRSARSDRSSF
jgi:membrane-associated protein